MEILPNEILIHIFNQINIFDILQSTLFLVSKHFYNLTIGTLQSMKHNITILKNLLIINKMHLHNLIYNSNHIIANSKIGRFKYFKSVFNKNKVSIEIFSKSHGIGTLDFCHFKYSPKVELTFGLSPFDDITTIRTRFHITDYHIECQDSHKQSEHFKEILLISQLLYHGMVFLQYENIF